MLSGKCSLSFVCAAVLYLFVPGRCVHGVGTNHGPDFVSGIGDGLRGNPRWRREARIPSSDMNGGTNCAACTVVVSLSGQLAEVQNETIAHGLERICSFLPESYQMTCDSFVEIATPILIEMAFDDYITPDVACQLLGFCNTDPGQEACHLYPLHSVGLDLVLTKVRQRLPSKYTKGIRPLADMACPDLPVFKEICEVFEKRFGDKHLPVVDIDHDNFSVFKTLRGSFWRGKDCNDLMADFHPGAKAIERDEVLDSNCNGIYGVDPLSKRTFEELLCDRTPRMGVAVLGDSMGAHFHIPKQWFVATDLNVEVFKYLPMVVENEMNWPMTSAFTGFMNSTWPVLSGPTDSFYLRLRELNHCNHRDFQNIGVNGADVHSMNETIQYGLSRDQKGDHPLFLVYSLVANDVCNGHNDTISHMTTPEEVKENFLSTLKFLDAKLPSGSHVIVTGLLQFGEILLDVMQDRVHPIGEWRHDVTYGDVYAYLECLGISPCLGWLSKNETIRRLTSQRAANLSNVLENCSSSFKAVNFDIHYIDAAKSWGKVDQLWRDRGGESWQLYEPVDGLHPSQLSMPLFSDVVWKEMERRIPDVVTSWRNPENDRIKAIFGDQGGY